MAKNALLLHGTNSAPNDNWLPWLKNQLAWRGWNVEVPQLPRSDEPNMARYWKVLENYPFNQQTVIVGHSSGGVTALGILDRIHTIVDRVYCVGAFYRDAGWNCSGLFEPAFDYERIKSHAKHIELWWSPGDAYIDKEQTDYLSEHLGVKPRLFPEGFGHFNTEVGEGFLQLPELAEAIMSPSPGNLL